VHSLLLLALVSCLLAVPGIAASLAAFPPGEVSVVIRAAAAFGLGYAASGGCAFVLAAVHAFQLNFFILSWLVVSAILWLIVLRRTSLRLHAHALLDDLSKNTFPLLVGVLVLAAILILHFQFLHVLGAPRYVYYLNGLEIANSGGVPSSTLEYGQAWPPATDKIFLDAFTGAVVLLDHNVVIGPGVLLLISILGFALGLWATAWELGLRRTGALLPLLLLSSQVIFNTTTTADQGQLLSRRYPANSNFADYHADDFGRAVAYCALALCIVAIRQRRWRPAAVAGIVLAAASGTHLIVTVVVVIAVCCAGAAELLRGEDRAARLLVLRQVSVLGGVFAFLGLLIRLSAGGSFGLGGASNPSGYAEAHTSFDASRFLFTSKLTPQVPGGHWYVSPSQVFSDIMAGSGISLPVWGLLPALAGFAVGATLLFVFARTDVRIAGLVGFGIIAGIIVASMLFAYHYHVYLEATFGVRRLKDFSSLGSIIIALGVLEALLLVLDRRRPRLSTGVAAALIIVVSAWVLPTNVAPQQVSQLSRQRIRFFDWVRTQTPCNARFLIDERTEGPMTALTGRFALMEGMGAFLRVDKLPYLVSLMLASRKFFESPRSDEAFLREHGISYVVATQENRLLGINRPTGKAKIPELQATPFLKRNLATKDVVVYRVLGVDPPPVSPLLTGPYLHCIRTPVQF
jgi:hypothetical protein